jgi:Protein of unknown function (DUF1236)
MMRFSFRHGAMLLAVLGGFGVALSMQTGDRASDAATDETTGSLGPTGARRMTQPLPLTDEERARIHSRVIRMPHAPTVDVPPPELLGALPSHVPLQELPAGVAQDIPLVQGYKFVKLDDRILIVSPATRIVVSEIPRYKLVMQ